MEELGEKVKFSFWEKYDDSHTVVRFATSWATKMEDIDSLIEIVIKQEKLCFASVVCYRAGGKVL